MFGKILGTFEHFKADIDLEENLRAKSSGEDPEK